MADGKVTIATGLDLTGAIQGMTKLKKRLEGDGVEAIKKVQDDATELIVILEETGNTGSKSMRKLSNETTKATKTLGSLKSALGKIVSILGIGFSIGAIINLGKQSLEIASDLTEVQNVVDTAFGSMSQKMEDFADTAIETYGISKLTAKNIGSTYTAMARGMGQSLDEATDKALEMTGRVADIASFYNLTIDRANTIGRAVYSGETEPLKEIGVIMTQDQLAAYALANGYSKLYKNMSAAEQLQVRQEYFLSQTSLAAGDFVKTQDSWANQTKILSERWKEFLSVLGNGLIQILTPAVKFLNQLVSAMTQALTAFNKFLGIETEISSTGSAGIADIASSMDDVTNSTEEASDAQKDLLGSYDKLNVISKDTSPSSSSSGTGTGTGSSLGGLDITESVGTDKTQFMNRQLEIMKTMLSGFVEYVRTNFGSAFENIKTGIQSNLTNTKTIFSNILEDIKMLVPPFITYLNTDFPTMLSTALNTAGNILNGTWDSINNILQTSWDSYFYPVLSKFVEVGLPLVTQFTTEAMNTFNVFFNTVKDLFDTAWDDIGVPFLDTLANITTGIWDSLKEIWDEYGKPIFDDIKDAIEKTGDTLKNIWDTIFKPIYDSVKETIDELWQKYLQPFITNVGLLVAQLIDLALRIYNNVILPIISWLVDTLGPIVSSVIANIVSTVGNIIGPIVGIINGIITVLRGVILFLDGAFSGDWQKCWEGIKLIFKGIWDTMVNIIKIPINLIIGLINTMIGAIQSGLNVCIKGINKLSFKVPDWVPAIGGNKFGFSLPTLSLGRIPYLASGAVIPPNQEFMAVLGDQKSGTNIETPLKTMIEAFETALDTRGGSTNNQPIILQLPNGKVIAELVWSEEEKRYKQTGLYQPKYS